VPSGGDVIDGKYKVGRLVGEGGMGAVYEGINLRLGRRVAIKVMHANVARERDGVQRFEREAQAASRIGSNHIVDVLDLGDLPSGERYMVMEFLDGESLSARIKRVERLSPTVAARVGVQLLEGLEKVHEAGIVHRDLKPANVFLVKRADGTDFVKILDFGVCKMTRNRIHGDVSTGVGDLLGTPAYMAPEALEHGPSKVDARADLYAVGVLLYRLVAGRLPYRGKNFVELVMQLRAGKATPLADIVLGIDPLFALIVDTAIEWDRVARFQSAVEFRRALHEWLGKSSRVDRLLSEFLDVPRARAPSFAHIPDPGPPPKSVKPPPLPAGAKPTPSRLPPIKPPPKKPEKKSDKPPRVSLSDADTERRTNDEDDLPRNPRKKAKTERSEKRLSDPPPRGRIPSTFDSEEAPTMKRDAIAGKGKTAPAKR
jgi:eukaryotic-like serine/threonine-protein kinase